SIRVKPNRTVFDVFTLWRRAFILMRTRQGTNES
ncbi:MAG: hypothetical protein ACI9W3_001059, partial [Marinoscillum sp.]